MTESSLLDDLRAALADQYAIDCEIGRGGMGVVYRARGLKLDRVVAIKTLPAHLASDTRIRERFLREAQTAAALSHPNIVPVFRADEIGGHAFFVMGYVDGASLAARIRDRGRLDPSDVARYMQDVASALAYAHSRQVIHRDVKVENILVDIAGDHVIVTDFGIARLAESAPLTATGQMLGTVYYLSPEQILGHRVDGRSDIYSLGVVGYFALSGRLPFDGDLASAVLVAHVNTPTPPLRALVPGAPAGLVELIERCLAKDPRDRPQDCGALAKDLERVIAGKSPGASSAAALPAPLVSNTEVHAILNRAAELDGLTAARSRPLAIARERDAAADMARTSGMRVEQLRDAAIEAGIGSRHVERALEEHGLVGRSDARTSTSTTPPVIELSPTSEVGRFGVPTDLRYEVVVEGEMRSKDSDILAETIRRRTDSTGELLADGRSFHWQIRRLPLLRRPIGEKTPREIEVSVLPANGKTSIFVRESLASDAGKLALLGGLVSLLAWALTEGAIVDITGHGLGPVLTKLWLLLTGVEVVGIFAGARQLMVRLSRKRQRFLRALAETLGAQARDSAATSLLKPGAPEQGSRRLKTSSAG